MSTVTFEVLFILLLLVANGVFAMFEIAVISARKSRLQRMAEAGDESARAAFQLATDPARFLSTIQIGITLVGILAGAFGGATIAEQLGARLDAIPQIGPYGEAIGLGIVVLCITLKKRNRRSVDMDGNRVDKVLVMTIRDASPNPKDII